MYHIVVAAGESFGVSSEFSKVVVIVNVDTVCASMFMELCVPVSDDGWRVCFRDRLRGSGYEGFLMLFVPLGEVV